AFAAIVERIDHLIVVVVVYGPFHPDAVAVANDGRRDIEAWSGRTTGSVAGIGHRDFRQRLIADSHLDVHIVEIRGDVAGKVVEGDALHAGRNFTRVKHGFPLDKAGSRSADFGILKQIDLLPRAPVAVGIVDVAAAHEQFDVPGTAHVSAAPAGKDA